MRSALLLLALAACGGAPHSNPRAIPDTPAGRAFAAWLDAFDSGDAARIDAFVAKYHGPPAAQWVDFRAMTGGLDLVSITESEPLRLELVVKDRSTGRPAVGWLTLTATEPAQLDGLDFKLIPPGATAADMNPAVDAATRARVVDALAAQLTALYVDPDVGAKMVQALREDQRTGAYDAIARARPFAEHLSERLRAISHDGHLRVGYSPEVVGADDREPTADEQARMRADLERMHCGFQPTERLDGHIGYLRFDMFGETGACAAHATAAFAALGDVDALIIDLRHNGGGFPDMVSFVASYLFAARTHLNDLADRAAGKTQEFWTSDVPGARFPTQPIYVLVSHETFSGAEEFAYDLQTQKRATIVGETTGGGAHPSKRAKLDAHFFASLPFARAINPITHTDWEGTGVVPDVKVPADQALETAKQLAARK